MNSENPICSDCDKKKVKSVIVLNLKKISIIIKKRDVYEKCISSFNRKVRCEFRHREFYKPYLSWHIRRRVHTKKIDKQRIQVRLVQ